MDDKLVRKSIELALNCQWSEAILTNLTILKTIPNDVDTLNRLSQAYYENGDVSKAKSFSLKVIKLEPNNSIALKAIEKYKHTVNKNVKTTKRNDLSVFIEEPGKTKLTNLINTNLTNICSSVDSGDEIQLISRTHTISLLTFDGKYLGKLTDDLSANLRKFIKGGNEYKAFVKSINGKNVKILIRECYRSDKFKNIQSFPRNISEPISKKFTNSDY